MKELKRSFVVTLQKRLSEKLNFIQVVLGPRQVGKTTGLRQVVKAWKGPSLMISADEVSTPSREWIELHWQRARQMGNGVLFVIDEVQKISHWATAVKHLFDQDRKARKMKVVLLGSAGLAIQTGLGESLAGRFEIIRSTHWNLEECRVAFKWKIDEFLKFGGYPAAAELIKDVSRWQRFVHDSIIEPVLIKDIAGLVTIGKPALFRQTFQLAMSYPAQEISLQKMLGQLQDKGNVTTIRHYLDLFESAFLLKTLEKFSGSKLTQKGSSPKIIPLCNALIHAFQSPEKLSIDPAWRGCILEASVGAALSTSSGRLTYWREGNYEVDFVLEFENKLFAIEVKTNRVRHFQGLEKFVQRYPRAIPILLNEQNVQPLLESNHVDSFIRDNRLGQNA